MGVAALDPSYGASHSDMFRNALKIGVPIAFGTDAAVYPHGINAQEFGDMVELGVSPSAALLASARVWRSCWASMGKPGCLEAGKFADIVAVPGDVLQNIRATEKPVLVMKQGGGQGREVSCLARRHGRVDILCIAQYCAAHG